MVTWAEYRFPIDSRAVTLEVEEARLWHSGDLDWVLTDVRHLALRGQREVVKRAFNSMGLYEPMNLPRVRRSRLRYP